MTIQGHAKATFGQGAAIAASATRITTHFGGENLTTLTFRAGTVDVEVAVAGASLRQLVDELIEHMGTMNRQHAKRALKAVAS